MSDCIVAKFGGSSLADSAQFKKVKSIVQADERRRYIVPSAPGKRDSRDIKVTDLFYLCNQNARQNMPYGEILGLIVDRYEEIIRELGLTLSLEQDFALIKETIDNGASDDYAASRGEYLNGKILADYLGFPFVDPADIIVIGYKNRTDWEKTSVLMNQMRSKHDRAVIPGFYGRNEKGEITTFSRGGSDVTGAVVARGVEAAIYENWTDVSGFLMTDPRLIDNPKPIAEITYKELRELSYMGASVLHEEAMFPVMKAKIPINIKNTNDPDAVGTFIKDDSQVAEFRGITGIAGIKGFTSITIEKMLMNTQVGFMRRTLNIFESNEVSIEHTPTGIDTISVIAKDGDLEGKLDKIQDELQLQLKPERVLISPDMAIIAIVGRGMVYNIGISARIFTALAEKEINVRMISQGSSEISIIIGVDNDDYAASIAAIYHAFE